jgi:hypothetical protein
MTEEVIGTFKIEQTPAKYGGYRTVVIDEQGKQVGSTFDDDVGNKLAGYPEGAVVAVDVDKSGRFWEIDRRQVVAVLRFLMISLLTFAAMLQEWLLLT